MPWIGVVAFVIGISVLIAVVVVSLNGPRDPSGRPRRDRFVPGNNDGDGG